MSAKGTIQHSAAFSEELAKLARKFYGETVEVDTQFAHGPQGVLGAVEILIKIKA